MALTTLQLAPRSDGARYRRLTLQVERDGAVTLSSHEMGASLDAAWGADDEEITLTVPAEQVARLTLALAAELLEGQTDAVDRLRNLCEAHGVDARIACWT